MLNNLLETCLKQFEPITEQTLQKYESFEMYNIFKTLFAESCPSLMHGDAQC